MRLPSFTPKQIIRIFQREGLKERKAEEKESGQKARGRVPVIPDPKEAMPDPKAQRNFTDPESRIMKGGASKGFEQAYNAQIAVDEESQVIVAAGVTQETNDKKQLVPMMKKVKENTRKLPEAVSADAGYFSETNVTAKDLKAVDLYIPPDRQKHGEKQPTVRGRPPKDLSVADGMRRKLRTKPDRRFIDSVRPSWNLYLDRSRKRECSGDFLFEV